MKRASVAILVLLAFGLGVSVDVPSPVNIAVDINDSQIPSIAGNTTDTPEITTEPPPDGTTSDGNDLISIARVEALVHSEINERRTNRGLSSLTFDSELRNIARDHSAVMARHADIFHTQPGGDTMTDRYEAAGYDCRVSTGGSTYATGAENVAKSWYRQRISTERGTRYYDSPQELATGLVNQWMNSTGHRENILKPYWNREGIGINVTREDGNIAIYATQNFC